MVRTQIQLPDDLYRRAKAVCAAREMSLAELARRGVELMLDRLAPPDTTAPAWTLPRVDARVLVPLERLREIAAEDESRRPAPRRPDARR
jgi:hypothetical protein